MTTPPPYPSPRPSPPPVWWQLPKAAYTPWSKRAVAFLIDWTPIWLVFVIPAVGMVFTGDTECLDYLYGSGSGTCDTASSNAWLIGELAALLPAAVYFFWNFCYRQGKTGQSIGKSVMKFVVISEKTWRPIGFWMSLVRQIAHYIDQLFCYIGYLFPLWDAKRQTIADKIMSTVCVPMNPQPLPR